MSEFMGGTFMLGADFSHHQWNVKEAKRFNPAYLDFIILKATEGKTHVDESMNEWLQLIADTRSESGSPFIFFYHYARPENNDPIEEAKHFIKTIDLHIGVCGVALDWEGDSLNVLHGEEWAYVWLEYVYKATNNRAKPLFYTSAAYTGRFSNLVKAGYPLWVAHYGTPKPKVIGWDKPTMWQFTSRPFDMNIFFGSPADMVNLIHSK